MPNATPFELPPRFWDKTHPAASGCILWTGAVQSSGYGSFSWEHKIQLAHRVAYVAAKGSIPEGWQVDHLCRVRLCVNADHLEAVTVSENNLRAAPFRTDERATIRHRFVIHESVDPVNGKVWTTHRDYPYWRGQCGTCRDAVA